jgi:hypothetical protein
VGILSNTQNEHPKAKAKDPQYFIIVIAVYAHPANAQRAVANGTWHNITQLAK